MHISRPPVSAPTPQAVARAPTTHRVSSSAAHRASSAAHRAGAPAHARSPRWPRRLCSFLYLLFFSAVFVGSDGLFITYAGAEYFVAALAGAPTQPCSTTPRA